MVRSYWHGSRGTKTGGAQFGPGLQRRMFPHLETLEGRIVLNNPGTQSYPALNGQTVTVVQGNTLDFPITVVDIDNTQTLYFTYVSGPPGPVFNPRSTIGWNNLWHTTFTRQTSGSTATGTYTAQVKVNDILNNFTNGYFYIQVSPGVAGHFVVSGFPTSTPAWVRHQLAVTAYTIQNTIATNYTGTVHFTSSDGQAMLPNNATLNNGTGTCTAILQAVRNGSLFAVGGNGLVQVRRTADGSLVTEFAPYGTDYTGPISVAIGDVNGDGYDDLVTGATVGNPDVRVYDGQALATGTFDATNPGASQLVQWFPYGLNLNVSANVAVGNVSGNGYDDVVTGASAGNPDMRVFSGKDIANGTFDSNGASLLAQWFPYAMQFNVGANVAAGHVNHDGYAEVVTGATVGNPDVRVYSGKDIAQGTVNPTGSSELAQFFAYGLNFNVGAFVAVGDTSGDGNGDIITGASAGNPDVHVYDGTAIARGTFDNDHPENSQVDEFFAYQPNFDVGAAVAAADFEGNRKLDILTGSAEGSSHFRVVHANATGIQPTALFEDIPTDLGAGIYVGA